MISRRTSPLRFLFLPPTHMTQQHFRMQSKNLRWRNNNMDLSEIKARTAEAGENWGTEKDGSNCSFFLKTGSCRYGDVCRCDPSSLFFNNNSISASLTLSRPLLGLCSSRTCTMALVFRTPRMRIDLTLNSNEPRRKSSLHS